MSNTESLTLTASKMSDDNLVMVYMELDDKLQYGELDFNEAKEYIEVNKEVKRRGIRV